MLKQKGQSTLEYVVLVIIVMAVFLTVRDYVKRGIQGRWKSAIDDVGEQYDPLASTTGINYSLSSNAEMHITTVIDNQGVWTSRRDKSDVLEIKNGDVIVSPE